MKKLSAALLLYLGLACAALAQSVSWPPPSGTIAFLCVYNTSPPTLTNGQVGFAQCDSTGKIITSGGGGGGGLSVIDQTTWTQGTSPFTPSGGVFNDTATLSSGQQGTYRLTTKRGQIVDIDASGNQLHTDLTSPIADCGATPCTNKIGTVGINTWAGGVLGAMANYGTSPGAVLVPGVNAFITNTVPVTGTFWQATQPVSIASLTPVAPAAATATQGNLLGCQYNSTNQAFTNGQQGSVGCDQRGGLSVQDGQAIASVSVTSATTLFTVADTSGYGSISVQVTSAGTTCTITYEASEDGTTFTPISGHAVGSSPGVTTSTAIGLFIFPVSAKQFRARVSTYTSGTVTVQSTLRKDAPTAFSITAAGTVVTTGANNDGNGVGASGTPIMVEGRTTNKNAVTTGQYVRPIATSIGVAINKPYQVPELDWTYVAAAGGITNTTTAVTMVAAAGAGIRNYLTGIQLSNSTLGAASEIAIRDGAAGTVLWRGFANTAASDPTMITFPSPIRGTANTLMEFVTLTASVTGALYVNAQGYQAP